jgi:hypothetical protein
MALYRLQSTPMICAPGLIAFAQRHHQEGDTARARDLVNAWPGLPAEVVDQLLAGMVKTEIDDSEALIIDTGAEASMSIAAVAA